MRITIICSLNKLFLIYSIACLHELSSNLHWHKTAYHHSVSTYGPQIWFTITSNLYHSLLQPPVKWGTGVRFVAGARNCSLLHSVQTISGAH
jgi:hypothetical protein